MTTYSGTLGVFAWILVMTGLAGCTPQYVTLDTVKRDGRRCQLHTLRGVWQWEWPSGGADHKLQGAGYLEIEPRLELDHSSALSRRNLIVRGSWNSKSELSTRCYRFAAESPQPVKTDCVEWERAEEAPILDKRVPESSRPAISPSGKYVALQKREIERSGSPWFNYSEKKKDSLLVTEKSSGRSILALAANESYSGLQYFWVGDETKDMIVIILNLTDVEVITFNDEPRAQ